MREITPIVQIATEPYSINLGFSLNFNGIEMKYLSLCIACFSTGVTAQEVIFHEANKQINIRHSDGLIESWKAPEDGIVQVTYNEGNDSANVRMLSQSTISSKRYIVQLTEPSLSVIKRKNTLLNNKNTSSSLPTKQEQALESALARQSSIINRQQGNLLSAASKKGIEYTLIDRNRRLLNTLVIDLSPEDAEVIKTLPEVKQVFEDKQVRANLNKSTPLIGATQVWQQLGKNGNALTGQGIKVAILDTGVDYTHSSLGGCLGADCKVVDGYDFAYDDNDPMDVRGHGTHVASIVAGNSSAIKGVAPDAKIYAYKVLNDNGSGYISDIVAGLERAVDPDGNPNTDDAVDIINMSLGGPGTSDDPLSQASNAAFMEGVLVVAAAGNDYNYETVGSPALAQHVLAVGATNNSDVPASFTSKGPATKANYIKPEISAPGVDIYAAVPEESYSTKSGTSMASPHVAGAAALLMQAKPELSVSQIKSQLISGVKALDYEPYVVGSGRLDIPQSITNDIILDTPTLFLGRVNTSSDSWQVTKQFTLTNTSSKSHTLSVTTNNLPSHANITFSTSSVTLAAGESKTVTTQISVNISELQYRHVGVGAWYFNINIADNENRLTLPVVYEHNKQITLSMDRNVWWVRVYDPITLNFIKLVYVDFSTSASFKLTADKATFMFRMNSFYSPLNDDDDYPDEARISRSAYVFKSDIDLSAATTNLSVSVDDLKYKMDVSEFIHKGTSFNYGDIEYLGENLNFGMEDKHFYAATTFTFCGIEFCKNMYPSEYHFSDVPEGFSLFTEEYYIDKRDYKSTEYFLVTRTHNDITQSVSESLDTGILTNPTWHYQAPEGESAMIQTNNWTHSEKHTADPISIKAYTTNKPNFTARGTYIKMLKYNPDNWWNEEFATTGHWEANANNSIHKRANRTQGRNNYQAYKAIQGNDFNFAESFRYWSAKASYQDNILYLSSANGYPIFFSDYGFVRDSFQNKFSTDNEFNYTQICKNNQLNLVGRIDLDFRYDFFNKKFFLNTDEVCASHELEYSNYFNRIEYPATATYHYKTDGSVPGIQHMEITQQSQVVESISRITNELTLNVQSEDDDVSSVNIYMQYAGDDHWLSIYGGVGEGTHTTSIPLTGETRAISLKIELTGENGNRFVNIIPKALEVGANVNGDNDADSDGIPNGQDTDNDNDGIPNDEDLAEYDPTPQTDTDNDGIIDSRDSDDDNDQIPDSVEIANGLDPLSANDANEDADNDGLNNLREYQLGTNINDRDSDDDGVIDGIEVKQGRDPLIANPRPSQDFNNDGLGDILYRDSKTQQWQIQTINGSTAPMSENIGNMSPYAFWEFQGTGDFNADGNSDVLIRHKTAGSWYVYFMDGAQIGSRGSMPIDKNLEMATQAIADFNSDGYPDLLLRNTQTGEWQIALLGFRKVLEYVPLPIMTKAMSWEVATVQDMDDDGNPDILIRNNISGSFYIYMFESTEIVYRRSVKDISPGGGNAIEKEEQIVAITDFDGDNKPDVLVRSELYSHYRVTMMDGYQSLGAFTFALHIPFAELDFVAADDFTGDGLADLILSQDQENTEQLHLMQSIGGVPTHIGALSQGKLPTQIPQSLH